MYEKAIELNPGDAYFYNNRGNARRVQGDLVGALADINKSIALDSNNAEAYCNLSLVYLSQNDEAKAKSNLEKCYALDAQLKSKYEPLVGRLRQK